MNGKVQDTGGTCCMVRKNLDISGKTGPYCLFLVAREAKALKPSGELLITCDNFPAVTTYIPRIAREENLTIETGKRPGGLWEIRLARE